MARTTLAEVDRRLSTIEKTCAERSQFFDAVYKEIEELGTELRQIREWLLGDGDEGFLEQVRVLTKQVESLQKTIAADKQYQNKLNAAVITGRFSLAGVVVLAIVQLVIHFLGGG